MGDPGNLNKKKGEIHVLVTGAGPFREHRHNPANMIVSALGSYILPKAEESKSHSQLDIHLYPTPAPWNVSYSWINENVPPMLFPPAQPGQVQAKNPSQQPTTRPRPNYDIVLFVGMAGNRDYYSLESQAHRDGYELPDADDKTPSNTDYWPKLGAPETLPTTFNTEALHTSWKANVPEEIDVQVSNNAGRYLCDYIYYTGLFEYWLQSGRDPISDRPVIFLHVPGAMDPESIDRGVIAATELIRAMAHQWAEKHNL